MVRAGGAIPVVFLIAAYPLWLLAKRAGAAPAGRWVAGAALAGLMGTAALVNNGLYFERYPEQYTASAQNASEIGKVIYNFAHSIGSYETAAVRPYPYWVDTRAVGMYADHFGWDAAIQEGDLGRLQDDPRPRLFILHRDDRETLAILRREYPTGSLSVYASAWPNHDFLIYFVPGTLDADENTLPSQP